MLELNFLRSLDGNIVCLSLKFSLICILWSDYNLIYLCTVNSDDYIESVRHGSSLSDSSSRKFAFYSYR